MALKKISGFDRARRKVYQATGAPTGKIKQGARNFKGNITSTPARTPGGEKIGSRDPEKGVERFTGRYYSGLAGLTGGTLAGDQIGRAKYRHDVNKAFRPFRPKVHRITDLGSPAAKEGKRKHQFLSPKTMGVGAAVGIPSGTALTYQSKKIDAESKKYVKKNYDPNKSLGAQKIAFKDKAARSRVNTEYGGRLRADVKAHRKANRGKTAKEIGVGTALGAGAGSLYGRKAYGVKPKSKGGAVAAGLGAAVGATYGTIPSTFRNLDHDYAASVRARSSAINSGVKRGDVVRVKDKKEVGSWSGLKKNSTSAFGVDHG